MTCKFQACEMSSRSLGYCSKHYDQYHKYGFEKDTSRLKEGQTKHPLYKTWQSLKLRCYNVQDSHYKWYGSKGIKVCERWTGKYGFYNFIEDMGERPKGYSLDRIDCGGDYEPSNCRWASVHTQNANRMSYNNEVPGVTKKETGRWRARLMVSGKNLLDKSFATYEEAVKARQQAEKELICQ